MKKTVVELFAGVGGFRVGLNNIKEFDNNGVAIENRDWDFVWANQWEPSTKTQDAFNCYSARFNGKGIHSNEDIASVNKESIPDHSLLVGGFPCQDYSVAHSLSTEKGIEGKKGVLFWEIADILKVKKSPFVLLENVDRLLKSPAKQRGRDFGIMLRTFYDLGYNVEWRIINAAEYGCAQKRRRIFIFAWRRGFNYDNTISQVAPIDILQTLGIFAETFPLNLEETGNYNAKNVSILEMKDTVEMTKSFKYLFENTGVMINGQVVTLRTVPLTESPITLREILDTTSDLSSYYLSDKQIKQFETLRGAKKKERRKPNGDIYYYSEGSMSPYDDLDLPGRTMLTSESSVNRSTHILKDEKTDKLRFLTPIEAEHLQHFPSNWTNTGMSEKKRYFMMGNALVTQIINRLEPILSNIIENE